MDFSGIMRDGRVTNELGIGSLGQAIFILRHKEFENVIDSE